MPPVGPEPAAARLRRPAEATTGLRPAAGLAGLAEAALTALPTAARLRLGVRRVEQDDQSEYAGKCEPLLPHGETPGQGRTCQL